MVAPGQQLGMHVWLYAKDASVSLASLKGARAAKNMQRGQHRCHHKHLGHLLQISKVLMSLWSSIALGLQSVKQATQWWIKVSLTMVWQCVRGGPPQGPRSQHFDMSREYDTIKTLNLFERFIVSVCLSALRGFIFLNIFQESLRVVSMRMFGQICLSCEV
jgi:hypothetical protein